MLDESPLSAGGHIAAQLRNLPSIDQLLTHPTIASLAGDHPRQEIVAAARLVVEVHRRSLLQQHHPSDSDRSPPPIHFSAPEPPTIDFALFAREIREELFRRAQPCLRRVVNATGIVLHTGLGRAPLAQEAVNAIVDVAAGYCNLELNLASGGRGDRHDHVRPLLCELTGAEDALVVNNNAAATLLALAALATGREALIARGQLVEIGGSYRLPDIMAASGCHMVEVGTTNRTRIGDYAARISPQTAVLLRVHSSNYRILGFTAAPALSEYVALARAHHLVFVDDLGSGLLDRAFLESLPGSSEPYPPVPHSVSDLTETPESAAEYSSPIESDLDEPSVRDSIAAGADLVLFSGDKLLGGPQAGIIVGRADLIARLHAHPLMRAFRPDKLTFAALEATLRLYRDRARLFERLPTLRMLTARAEDLRDPAESLCEALRSAFPEGDVEVRADASFAGGGSLPLARLATWTVAFRHPRIRARELAAALRQYETPVIARLAADCLVFDCRTLQPDEAEVIVAAVNEGLARTAGP